jgi:predicted SprT family Zn-dependent metalloprotease
MSKRKIDIYKCEVCGVEAPREQQFNPNGIVFQWLYKNVYLCGNCKENHFGRLMREFNKRIFKDE